MMLKYETGCIVGSCRRALQKGWFEARSDCGSNLVEFALALPLLLLMTLGTVDLGRLAYMYIEVNNAARAGVSYGSQSHFTAVDNTGMQTAGYTDASDLATGFPTNFKVTASSFCVCSNGNSQTSSPHVTCVASSCPGALLVQYVQVHTKASYQPWFPWPGVPGSSTVTANVQLQAAQ